MVYCFDWESLTEEFIKKMEESKHSEYIKLEIIEEYINSLCDEDVEEEAEEEIAAYEWYPPEFIEEIDKLMAQKPIDLPAGMSLPEYLKSLLVL